MNVKQILGGTLVATSLLTSLTGVIPAQAKELGSYSKIEVPTDKSKASNKYAMIAKFTEKSKLEFLTAKSKLKTQKNSAGKEVQVFLGLDKSDCGKDIARYTNVGLWEGKPVDVIYHLDSLTKAGFKGGEWLRFNPASIGITQGGYKEVKVTQRYVYHDTQKEAPVTGSYMTFNDIDAKQAVGFSDDTMKRVSKIYIDESTKKWVDVTEKNGMTYFGSPSDDDIEGDDPKGKMTMLFDGNAITYSFVKDWTGYNLDKEIDWANSQYNQYYGYLGEKPVRTETLNPTKLVSDKDEKDRKENMLSDRSEQYQYTISHSVPAEEKKFFYKEYSFNDPIPKELESIKNGLKVLDSDDKDVTNWFEIKNEDNKLSVVAKKETLEKSEFYGKDYRLIFTVKIKDDVDLETLKDSKGNIVITNKASVTKDGQKKETNETKTTLIPVDPKKESIQKEIYDDGKMVDTDEFSKEDSTVAYRVLADLPNKEMKSLVLRDELDSRLSLVDPSLVKVLLVDEKETTGTEDSSTEDSFTEDSATTSDTKETSSNKEEQSSSNEKVDSKKERSSEETSSTKEEVSSNSSSSTEKAENTETSETVDQSSNTTDKSEENTETSESVDNSTSESKEEVDSSKENSTEKPTVETATKEEIKKDAESEMTGDLVKRY